jgi:mRNA interferase MazF
LVKTYVPERGDVVWLDFTPQSGHEQAERRPALVLSPRAYNQKVGLGIFCPITKQIKGYPFESYIPEGTGVEGVVLADQIKNLDWKSRNATFICKMIPEVVDDCIEMIKALIFETC